MIIENIRKILEIAVQAPSGDNCQPWRFAVKGIRWFTVSVLTFVFAFLPRITHAFIDFCFPISFAILTYALLWPSWVVQILISENGKYDEFIVNLPNTLVVVIGILVDVMILFFVGRLFDKKNSRYVQTYKKKMYLLPAIFLLILFFLYFIIRFDSTCA